MAVRTVKETRRKQVQEEKERLSVTAFKNLK